MNFLSEAHLPRLVAWDRRTTASHRQIHRLTLHKFMCRCSPPSIISVFLELLVLLVKVLMIIISVNNTNKGFSGNY